jgi:hypothetical protein
MQIVSGEAVKLETVRYYVGSLLIGALAGAAFGMCLAARREEDKSSLSDISHEEHNHEQ